MSDYPDPNEEFELMYGDELDLLREQEEELYHPPSKSRKSLDFSTPSKPKRNENYTNLSQDRAAETFGTFETDFPALASQTEQEVTILESQDIQSNDRKRPLELEDLFGDIGDIGDDLIIDDQPSDQPNIKKHKGDQREEDLALIEHILELRRLTRDRTQGIAVKRDHSSSNVERDKHNLSYRVPKYPFIGVTRSDGERVYVRFHSEEFEREERERVVKECPFNGVMGDAFRAVWIDARNLINSQMDHDMESQTENEIAIIEEANEDKQLWVDLYKPKKYLELLSDESTNRVMLRWMKLWDKVVFNRKPKVKQPKAEPEGKKKFFQKQELSTNLDEHGRPELKVALLCGPPGLGKTTLAHMVARHAGYNVVEVNASDDRSTEAFKTSLKNATQMRSVVDQQGRPNCLVFDEIDGAPQASIDFLVKFVSGSAAVKPKKGKAQKQSILKRPIICICNDVFVPALRPLRQIAFCVNFPQTSSARLAERLMEIARRQGVKTDIGAMLALAGKSNNDIRSCLSVLHFFKAQNKRVTLSDVYRANVGQKDMQKGLFTVWNDIFQIERPAVSASSTNGPSDKSHSLKSRMAKILHTVSSFGDHERVAQGVFENFPKLKLKDSSMEGISEALDWFVYSDLLSKQIYSLQNYSLSSYLQYAFVVWHFVFATMQKPELVYPTAAYQARLKETRQKALVAEVLRGMQPCARAYCQSLSLILDILPLLSRIIVPPFRPVSLHLYTKQEKEDMLKVVNIMIDYNLNYVQQRDPDGTYSYVLEPNIDEVVVFEKSELFKRRQLSYSNKQLIAREVDMEKMRRFETPRPAEGDAKRTKEAAAKKGREAAGSAQLPNHLQRLQAKKVKAVTPAVTRDFFGRVIAKPTPQGGKTAPNVHNDIWYQYKEGYNNAVRKRITICSLK